MLSRGSPARVVRDDAHLEIVPDRIKRTLIGLKMPRAIKIRAQHFSGKI